MRWRAKELFYYYNVEKMPPSERCGKINYIDNTVDVLSVVLFYFISHSAGDYSLIQFDKHLRILLHILEVIYSVLSGIIIFSIISFKINRDDEKLWIIKKFLERVFHWKVNFSRGVASYQWIENQLETKFWK